MATQQSAPSESSALRGAGKKAQVVDLVAVIAATSLAALGVLQFAAPGMAVALTGLEAGQAGEILALQWLLMASLLFVGGALRVRVLTIFAAEFVVVGSLAAFLVVIARSPDTMPMIVHGGIALFALGSSGFARLADKAELKREVHLLRAAALQPDKVGGEVSDNG